MSGPLSGVRIIDLTTVVLGPVATQLLGDMGADVIKVETPEGDTMRQMGPARHANMGAMFLTNNRNKSSVVLNLKNPKARGALLRLTKTADVFVHNMRPRAAEKLGISYADLSAENPRLIYAFASGYRLDGQYRDYPAFDDVIQGWSGVPGLFAMSGKPPQFAPFAAADKLSGYVIAMSVAMALYHRERSGKGQEIHVPMLETMVSFNLHEHLWGGAFEPPAATLGYSRMKAPDRRPLETKDGHIVVMPVTDAQWNRMLLALDRPDLAQDERFAKMAARGQNFDVLYGYVAQELLKRTTADWIAHFDKNDIPCGPVWKLDDMLYDPYFVEGVFRTFEHPTEGPMRTTAVPVKFSETPGDHAQKPAPNLGEHTKSVLLELGYGADEIKEIMESSKSGDAHPAQTGV